MNPALKYPKDQCALELNSRIVIKIDLHHRLLLTPLKKGGITLSPKARHYDENSIHQKKPAS